MPTADNPTQHTWETALAKFLAGWPLRETARTERVLMVEGQAVPYIDVELSFTKGNG